MESVPSVSIVLTLDMDNGKRNTAEVILAEQSASDTVEVVARI